MDYTEFIHSFNQISAVLTRRVSEDPKAAIAAARTVLAAQELLDETHRKIIVSSVLTDAGSDCEDFGAVDEAVTLLEQLAEALHDAPNILYNLGNALVARANLTVSAIATDWYAATCVDRIRAKVLFQKVADHPDSDNSLRARALNNLGNSLARAYRLIEAYDCYARAIEQDPQNGVALSCAARSLTDLSEYGLVSPLDVEPAVASLVRRAIATGDSIADLAGDVAGAKIHAFLNSSVQSGELPDLCNATEYQRFVAKHRLALTPSIEGLDLQLNRWDSLRLASIFEQGKQFGIPPIFAMFNVLKSDFLAARYAAYIAIEQQCPESGKYYDTLDFALYGTCISMMGMAQKCCFDLLDKAAVAISSYLDIPGKPSDFYFSSLWFAKNKTGKPTDAPSNLRPEITSHIDNGDFPLIALAEVARDLGGYLKTKRSIRHATTHRFTVLHDLACIPSRESDCIEHHELEDFKRHLVESLQMSRAVLFYFAHLVSVHERRSNRGEAVLGVVQVPNHDYIRGDE